MQKGVVASIGSVVLAFLASQHHTLHMLLFSLGVGGAGMSFMTMFPLLRRIMLFMSLVMVGVVVYQMRNPKQSRAMLIASGASVLLTLGLMVWSVMQFGL